MTGTTFLQILLILQIFIMGGAAVIAFQHAYAHFRPKAQPAPRPQLDKIQADLPPEVKERLLKASQAQFEAALNDTAAQFQHNLKATAGQIDGLVRRLAADIVSGELEHYRLQLAGLHENAQKDMSGIRGQIEKHKAEIETRIAQELAAEKQRLVKQIDTKLADAVGSFLVEALQHNVDLGSQGQYLVALLEEHKKDFIREVADETQASG